MKLLGTLAQTTALLFLLAATAFLLTATAQAASISIGPAGCGSCAGLTLGLEANQVGDDVEVFLSYSAPTGWQGAPDWESYTGIGQAGFLAAKGWDTADITLVAIEIDGVSYDEFDNWSGAAEAVTSSASPFCSKGKKSDKACAYALTSDAVIDLAGGGTAVFEFHIADAALIEDTMSWHIGGQICDTGPNPKACNGHIISENAAVPEPTASLAFGFGLAVFAGKRRRQA